MAQIQGGRQSLLFSNSLEEYKDGYVTSGIDERDKHIGFVNDLGLVAGQEVAHLDERQLRRL